MQLQLYFVRLVICKEPKQHILFFIKVVLEKGNEKLAKETNGAS